MIFRLKISMEIRARSAQSRSLLAVGLEGEYAGLMRKRSQKT
jgi:hypothetical protein